MNDYTIKENLVRIGSSNVYLGERVEIDNRDGSVFPRIYIKMTGNGGCSVLDSFVPPTSEQASELIKIFSKYL